MVHFYNLQFDAVLVENNVFFLSLNSLGLVFLVLRDIFKFGKKCMYMLIPFAFILSILVGI